MTLEKAIKTALEYENKVRDTYLEAARDATDAVAKRVFKVLGDEEQGHVDYLNGKLEEWRKTGKVTPERLGTVVPSQEAIEEGVAKLDGHMNKADLGSEILEIEDGHRAIVQAEIDCLNNTGYLFDFQDFKMES